MFLQGTKTTKGERGEGGLCPICFGCEKQKKVHPKGGRGVLCKKPGALLHVLFKTRVKRGKGSVCGEVEVGVGGGERNKGRTT